jgi:hypothetical protein
MSFDLLASKASSFLWQFGSMAEGKSIFITIPCRVGTDTNSYVMGGATDKRYNMSFIVQNSVEIGKPIIGVSIAYRLSAWGFLDSLSIREEGGTNVGMKDQR